jgi:hypothetical protein
VSEANSDGVNVARERRRVLQKEHTRPDCMSLDFPLLDEHEYSNKENPRNGEPGCIYTIEYANSESSSLFFYNPSRETVVYCQSRLHYCYKATVRRSNK